MTDPKILCFSGSTRRNSYNTRLAALAKNKLARAGVEVTQISLADFPMPLYNADEETASGPPKAAEQLFDLMGAHHGIFVACPEYNGSITPLLKNTIDWISRVRRDDGAAPSPFKGRVFALGAASPGNFGGLRGLLTVRQVLEIALGAHVLAEQAMVPRCADAFDDAGEIGDSRIVRQLDLVLARLEEMATYYCRRR